MSMPPMSPQPQGAVAGPAGPPGAGGGDPQAGARQQAFVAILEALRADPQLAALVDEAITSAKMQAQSMQADTALYGGPPGAPTGRV